MLSTAASMPIRGGLEYSCLCQCLRRGNRVAGQFWAWTPLVSVLARSTSTVAEAGLRRAEEDAMLCCSAHSCVGHRARAGIGEAGSGPRVSQSQLSLAGKAEVRLLGEAVGRWRWAGEVQR